LSATTDTATISPAILRWRGAARWAALTVFAILWFGGVATAWLGVERADAGRLASLFLLAAGLIVLLGERTTEGALSLLYVAALGFAVEALGVHSGFPFGRYAYTRALQPQLLGVPLVMGLAWVVLVAFASDAAARLRLRGWTATLFAALLTTATDLVIDPLAASRLGYWRWEEAGDYYGIPFFNFAGWLLTALVAGRITGARENRWAGFAGAALILFFALLALAHSLTFVALVGLALCVASRIRLTWPRRMRTPRP
jgi:uncharacterized membrane protein